MKLDRTVIVVLVAGLAMGCGTRVSTQQVSTATARNPVSSARLMAAELTATDDAPRVGKSHRSEDDAADVEDGSKDVSRHHGERKPGGGFSGYK